MKKLIKEMNTVHILQVIRQNMPISRAEISRITGLTAATVSNNLVPLLERNVIKETGEGLSSGGRKPTMLELNSTALYSIGIDVGPTRIKAAVTDLAGNIQANSMIKMELFGNKERIIQLMMDVIRKLQEQHICDDKQLLGIGVGMHGLVNPTTGISLYAPAFQWDHVPIKQLLAEAFRKPIFVDNDVRAMALGEKWFGNAKLSDHFIYLNVGASIGSAIYSHGHMVEGAMQSAGEIGHIFTAENHIKCYCGKTGCLSTVASGSAMEQEAKRQVQQGKPSSLEQHLRLEGAITGEQIHQAAKAGDRLARDIFRQAADAMGKVLAAVTNMLNPEQIVFGGGVAKAADVLIPQLEQSIERYAMRQHAEKLHIVPTALKGEGGIIGAATLVLDAFFKQPGEF